MKTPEEKLEELGITLPAIEQPTATYLKCRKSGNLLYLSGHVSTQKGKLGRDMTTAEGAEAAKSAGIELLTTIKATIGELNKVKQFVKVLGMVNCTPDYEEHPLVINGFSDFMIEVFGEKGKHARSAVGNMALPYGYAVEIEAIVEVFD